MRIVPLAAAQDPATAGGKAAGLAALLAAGLPVPPGFVLALDEGGADDPEGAAPLTAAERSALAAALVELDAGRVAVRSSAVGEDGAEASAAGQQETVLGVDGRDPAAVADAVRRCRASLLGERAVAYRARTGAAAAGIAVVVQRMADADAAGVAFTADPRTGRRDRVLVSAARGLGESVVAGDVDPEGLVVDPAAGRVVERRAAGQDRERRLAPDGVVERPVPSSLRGRPVLDDDDALALARLALHAERAIGAPADVEWARERGRLLLLQARPITALPPEPGPVPRSWPVPSRRAAYFRASIVEQLPDPLSPLFEDLALPAATRALAELMARVLGERGVRPGDLGLVAVNGYAYYEYATAAFARILLRSPLLIPALVRGGGAGPRWWRAEARPAYERAVRPFAEARPGERTAERLLDDVDALLLAGMRYYTAVQTVIPVAASADGLFRWFAGAVARSPEPVVHLLGEDSEPILADRSLAAVAAVARRDPGLRRLLDDAGPVDVRGPAPAGVDPGAWSAFADGLRAHLDRFGHAVFDLDFADPLPADDPAAVRAALGALVRDSARDPGARQRAQLERRAAADREVRARLDPVRRAVFDRLLAWARRVGPAREDALADVGLAWPAIRARLLELGSRLVERGALPAADDVFFLNAAEARRLAAGLDAGDGPLPDHGPATADHRRQQRGRRLAEPPQLLPERGWGRVFERVMPAATASAGDELRGVPAGGGSLTAVARVVRGPEEADRLQPGEVLVTAITTPAWTPLFAVAGAVVTDVGGPLSHSSIVAREYGLPAVLGTRSATRRIRDGQTVVVDGDRGVVRLGDAGEGPEQPVGRAGGRAVAGVAIASAAVAALVVVLRRRR